MTVLARHHRRAELRLALFLAARPPTKPTTGRAMICDNTGNTCTATTHELECVSATCTYGQDCVNVVHADDCAAGWDRLTGVWADGDLEGL